MTLYKLTDKIYLFYGEDEKWIQLINKKAKNSRLNVYLFSPERKKDSLDKNVKIIRSTNTAKRVPWSFTKNSLFFLDLGIKKVRTLASFEIEMAFSSGKIIWNLHLNEIMNLIGFSDITCINKEIRKYK